MSHISFGNHPLIASFSSQANCAVLSAGICVKAEGSEKTTPSTIQEWGMGSSILVLIQSVIH